MAPQSCVQRIGQFLHWQVLLNPIRSEFHNQLLEFREIELQNEPSVGVSLSLYADTNTDFADSPHSTSAYANGRAPRVTFDRKTARLQELVLLERS